MLSRRSGGSLAGLIIGAIVMIQQLRFLQGRNPGFNKENVVMLDGQDVPDIDHRYPVFKQLLSACPEITGVGATDNRMGQNGGFASMGIKRRMPWAGRWNSSRGKRRRW